MRCWMAMSSTVMLKLAKLANATDWIPIIQSDQILFNNLTALDQLHWSDSAKGYFDYGLHSYNVKMMDDGTRHVLTPPEYRLVDDVFGYVNIFPFLLRQLPANSPKVGTILTNISDPNCLWTDFGLRSVAKIQNGKAARYYDAWNDAGDAPYWRGPIWINMNYFALDALKYYSTIDGPYKSQAGVIYTNLRANVIKNMGNVFNQTGFIWEHYNDKNGNGEGTRPFTGWSALVLAIMADDYR
uniref:mannosyl-oligosaccharide glucosidase n=1 Tax=Panagrolaimus davidi TaxID=227884 RepID=A0A914QJA4_9BILA